MCRVSATISLSFAPNLLKRFWVSALPLPILDWFPCSGLGFIGFRDISGKPELSREAQKASREDAVKVD